MTRQLQEPPLQEWRANCYDSGVPFILGGSREEREGFIPSGSQEDARRISGWTQSMAGNVTATKTSTEERLYTIGEVSRLADLKPFVLRYWESEIPMLQPTKDDAGRRVYRQQDVDMVFRIKRLLYDEGYTIAGARRHLREKGGADDLAGHGSNHSGEGGSQLLSRRMLLDLRDALHAFLTLLERR